MAESPWAEVTCSACSLLEAEAEEVRRLLATASDISGLEAGACGAEGGYVGALRHSDQRLTSEGMWGQTTVTVTRPPLGAGLRMVMAAC